MQPAPGSPWGGVGAGAALVRRWPPCRLGLIPPLRVRLSGGGHSRRQIAALFAAFPKALVVAVAAFALLGSIANGLAVAMQTPGERDAALLTFMITASGMTLLGVGSAFWGVVGGMLALYVLRPRPVA